MKPLNRHKPAVVPQTDHAIEILNFCAGQLQVAAEDARDEFDGLTSDIVKVVGVLESFPAVTNDTTEQQKETAASLNQLLSRLQFADRLSQRLSNTQKNLLRLSSTLAEYPIKIDAADWDQLIQDIRSNLTTAEERASFDRNFNHAADEFERVCAADVTDAITLFEEES